MLRFRRISLASDCKALIFAENAPDQKTIRAEYEITYVGFLQVIC